MTSPQRRSFLTLSLTALALCLPSCGLLLKGKATAEKRVADLHQLYNDGKHREIYTTAEAKLRSTVTEQQFLDRLATVQSKLGKVTGTTMTGLNLQSKNLVTTVELTQDTTFERGTAKETFTFLLKGKDALLTAYDIQSSALSTK